MPRDKRDTVRIVLAAARTNADCTAISDILAALPA